MAGAAIVFYAYIGFDAVSTHAEEARNPRRDVPIGIIASLTLCTVLYIAVGAVLTGMVPYQEVDVDAPLAKAFSRVGLPWAHALISFGALTGTTSVLMVLMLSAPRIMLAMARDGLLPASFFAAVHPRFRTPWKATILTGTVVGLMGALLAAPSLSRAGQHRHASSLCNRMRRSTRHAPDRSRDAPPIPLPPRTVDSSARYRVLSAADVFPAGRQLVALDYLAGDRFCGVFMENITACWRE